MHSLTIGLVRKYIVFVNYRNLLIYELKKNFLHCKWFNKSNGINPSFASLLRFQAKISIIIIFTLFWKLLKKTRNVITFLAVIALIFNDSRNSRIDLTRSLANPWLLTLSLLESNLEPIIKSVDETPVCDHSNESYWAVLSSGVVCLRQFWKMIFNIFSSVLNLALLGVKVLI